MSLSPGCRLGPYEIASPLGVGGMGEVFRATDTRLKRDVALKILPELFAADGERLARFQREAELLAALNHPHIAAIYGVEESGPIKALVLELVEGQTLADRIATAPIPPEDAIPIALQICEALEAAHEQGIVHRDLKPSNIKVTPGGTVKVLDFGLAKLIATEKTAPALSSSMSPTITSPALITGAGALLGTAAYMSPEQARGRSVDQRSDLWAFGCIVLEMLTGQRAFKGDEVADVLAAILEREPEFDALPAHTPVALRRLLQRCLTKNHKNRLAAAADARLELQEATAERGAKLDADVRGRSRRLLVYSAAVATVAIAVATAVLALRGAPVQHGPSFTATLLPPAGTEFADTIPATSIAVAPDGRHVAFLAAAANGVQRLWVRNLQTGESRALRGTDNGERPFWSPDSESIGFIASRQLKTVGLGGGTPFVVGALTGPGPGPRSVPAWNRDGVILFTGGVGQPLYRISASGGVATAATTLDRSRGETEHWYPRFLPDGKHFLFLAIGRENNASEANGVFVTSLDSAERTLLLPGGSNAQYAKGHLLFLRGQTVFAQPFDPDRRVLSGTPKPLVDGVLIGGAGGTTGAFSISDDVLVYRTGSGGLSSRLAWYDRDGKRTGVLGDPAEYLDLELSPDGTRLAATITDQSSRTQDLWSYDIARGVLSRITSGEGGEGSPVWASNSDVIFGHAAGVKIDIFRQMGGGPPEILLADARRKIPSGVGAKAGLVLFTVAETANASTDIWAVPLRGGPPFAVLQTPFEEREGRFSPDGQSIAYVATETGRPEIYVMPFGRSGERIRVSNAGGRSPRWRGDGTELFYGGLNNEIVAVAVSTNNRSPKFGLPQKLFTVRPALNARRWFDVSSDGQRFIIAEVPDEMGAAPLTMVVNWRALITGVNAPNVLPRPSR